MTKRRRNNSGINSGEQWGRVENLRAHQYKPGKSGNPKGRPRTKGLLVALRSAIAEVTPEGKTIEQVIVEELLQEATQGRRKLQAIAEIFDRLEGKPRQQVDWNDITKQLQGRTDGELLYFAEHGTWPDEVGND